MMDWPSDIGDAGQAVLVGLAVLWALWQVVGRIRQTFRGRACGSGCASCPRADQIDTGSLVTLEIVRGTHGGSSPLGPHG